MTVLGAIIFIALIVGVGYGISKAIPTVQDMTSLDDIYRHNAKMKETGKLWLYAGGGSAVMGAMASNSNNAISLGFFLLAFVVCFPMGIAYSFKQIPEAEFEMLVKEVFEFHKSGCDYVLCIKKAHPILKPKLKSVPCYEGSLRWNPEEIHVGGVSVGGVFSGGVYKTGGNYSVERGNRTGYYSLYFCNNPEQTDADWSSVKCISFKGDLTQKAITRFGSSMLDMKEKNYTEYEINSIISWISNT